jgi:hypothetical protein
MSNAKELPVSLPVRLPIGTLRSNRIVLGVPSGRAVASIAIRESRMQTTGIFRGRKGLILEIPKKLK